MLSPDGQSISGSWGTLTGDGHCPSMYCPGMVRVSRDLRISGYSDAGKCSAHPCAAPGQSEYHGSIRWDSVVCTSRCYSGKSEYFGSYGQVWYNPYFELKFELFTVVTCSPTLNVYCDIFFRTRLQTT